MAQRDSLEAAMRTREAAALSVSPTRQAGREEGSLLVGACEGRRVWGGNHVSFLEAAEGFL